MLILFVSIEYSLESSSFLYTVSFVVDDTKPHQHTTYTHWPPTDPFTIEQARSVSYIGTCAYGRVPDKLDTTRCLEEEGDFANCGLAFI